MRRTLAGATGSGRRRRDRDARWLARQLASRVPGARLPNPSVEASPNDVVTGRSTQSGAVAHSPAHRRSRLGAVSRPLRAVVLVACLCLVSLAFCVMSGRWSSSLGRGGQRLPCPQVDSGCRVVPTPAGVLTTSTGRYLVGEPDDVVVLGRWWCGSSAIPAVLRPRTGQLWTFVAWPKAGHGVRGQLVASHLYGAWTLRVLVQRSGCDRIEVERRGRPPLAEDVSR
jgi:hypothetical protein